MTQSALDIPGPGQYEIKSIIGSEGQKKSFGLKLQLSPSEKEELMKPGPGAYEPKVDAAIKAAPSYRVGTSI